MENPAIAGFALSDWMPPLTRRRGLFRSLNFSLSYTPCFMPLSLQLEMGQHKATKETIFQPLSVAFVALGPSR
jgi:hypothetical protein